MLAKIILRAWRRWPTSCCPGGYRGQADFLQQVAIVLLAIGVVCAIAALVSFFRQRG